MKDLSRRAFLRSAALSGCAVTLTPSLAAATVGAADRFQIGIQEYTFHRWLGKKLKHLDYPALVKDKLGIMHIEYWSRPFGGKHTDKAYVGDLVKRTTGEGFKNVLILVDAKNQLDSADAAQRGRALVRLPRTRLCARPERPSTVSPQ